jgi:hypothetical protein
VIGMLRDKDVDGVIRALASRVDHWIPVDLPGPRGASAEWLTERLHAMGVTEGAQCSIAPHASPHEGLAAAQRRAGPDDRILVFGSFLTVADVIAHREAPSGRRPSKSACRTFPTGNVRAGFSNVFIDACPSLLSFFVARFSSLFQALSPSHVRT